MHWGCKVAKPDFFAGLQGVESLLPTGPSQLQKFIHSAEQTQSFYGEGAMHVLSVIFSDNRFMLHGYCYLWNPVLVWLHALSDSSTALAYFSIPVTLVYFIYKRRDLAFQWMF